MTSGRHHHLRLPRADRPGDQDVAPGSRAARRRELLRREADDARRVPVVLSEGHRAPGRKGPPEMTTIHGGSGRKSHTYDTDPQTGRHYYRVQMIDRPGGGSALAVVVCFTWRADAAD